MTPNLQRFIEAQDADNTFEEALHQIKDGDLSSEWFPFVFPRKYEISMSDNENKFALYSLYEAEAYMCDHELSKRLYDATNALIDNHYYCDIEDVFGYEYSKKIQSCMTLFDIVSRSDVFEQVLDHFFDSERDKNVLEAVKWERELFHGEKSPYEKLNLNILERAMFDSYGEETKPYSLKMKIASYFRLYKHGYTPLELGRLYLVNHSDIYDSYRTSGMESFLSYFGFELLLRIYEYTQKNCSDEVLEQYVAQFDPRYYFNCYLPHDWEIYALKLQYLIEYIFGNPNYDDYVAELDASLDDHKRRY